jgi:hypothetical protein
MQFRVGEAELGCQVETRKRGKVLFKLPLGCATESEARSRVVRRLQHMEREQYPDQENPLSFKEEYFKNPLGWEADEIRMKERRLRDNAEEEAAAEIKTWWLLSAKEFQKKMKAGGDALQNKSLVRQSESSIASVVEIEGAGERSVECLLH